MKTLTLNVLLLLCTLSGLTFADTFEFKSDPYPPYIIADQYNNFSGGTIRETIIPIFQALLTPINIQIKPWPKVIDTIISGETDGTLAMKDAFRTQYMVFSDPVYNKEHVLFYYKDHNPIGVYNDNKQLSKYKIGLVKGYSYKTQFYKDIFKFRIDARFANSVQENIEKLQKGKLDYIAGSKDVILYLINQSDFDNKDFKYQKKPISKDYLYLAVSKKSNFRDIIPKFNQKLKELRKKGIIKPLNKPKQGKK